MGKTASHQAFVFTRNNWSPEDLDTLDKMFKKGVLQWVLFGKEVGKKTQTPHLQGFIWAFAPHTAQQMKRKLNGFWVGVPGKEKGPAHHADDDGESKDADGNPLGYCKKDGDWYESGMRPTEEEFLAQVPKGQGTRSDLLNIKHKIDEGTNAVTLLGDDDHFVSFASHEKFFMRYQAYKRARTSYKKPVVIVHWGETGANKTKRVWDNVTDINEIHVWTPQMGQWFDGYAGQKTVLFDEFRGQLPYGMMLSLLDGYPGVKVQTKGSMVDWSPETIYLTSPMCPEEWYVNNNAADAIAQLMRRIDHVVFCERPALE